MTMTTSVFYRLAHQGTVASDARLAEERKHRQRQQHRRDAAAAALFPAENPAKLQQLSPSQDVTIMKSPTRTPEQQDAFYNRIAHQDTVSSVAHHVPDDSASLPPPETPGPKLSPKQLNAFYNRLAYQETISSAAHHVPNDSMSLPAAEIHNRRVSPVFDRLYKQETAASKANHFMGHDVTPPCSSRKVRHLPPPSFIKRFTFLKRRQNNDKAKSGSAIQPRMILHIRTKEEKLQGRHYNDLDLSQSEVHRQVGLFSSGKISAKSLASDVMGALFHRDFRPGAHWKIGPAALKELDPLISQDWEKTLVFEVEMEAVWDWKDIYSVAKARATIKISSKDLFVDEYSYIVAG